jgi:hypothetical protein
MHLQGIIGMRCFRQRKKKVVVSGRGSWVIASGTVGVHIYARTHKKKRSNQQGKVCLVGGVYIYGIYSANNAMLSKNKFHLFSLFPPSHIQIPNESQKQSIPYKSRSPIDQPLNWHLVDMIYESAYTFQWLSKDGTEWGNTLAKFLQITFLISNPHWYMATRRLPNTVSVKTAKCNLVYRKHKLKRNHQLLGARRLLCKLQTHHMTSGTQGIDRMLPPVFQATTARKRNQRGLNAMK